jgi:hypothetical protein
MGRIGRGTVMSGAPTQTLAEAGLQAWAVLRQPLRVFLTGLAVILVFWVWGKAGLPGPGTIVASVFGAQRPASLDPSATLAAVLVMTGGLSVIGLLWWLTDRYFELIAKGAVAADLSALRDSPLGLPEGTVRAALALIVALVGLPVLVFSNTLQLDNAIAGYINGIISGVFGFYFGSRMPNASAAAVRQAAAATRLVDSASAAAQSRIAAIEAERDAAQRKGAKGPVVDQLTRHLELAKVLQDPIGPLLPAGLLPPGFNATVAAADTALAALGGDTPDADAMQKAGAAADALLSGSAIGRLIKAAAPLTGGTAATLASLLAVGWNLGASAYQRWNALLLGAPVTASLFDGGPVTPEELTAAIAAAGTLPGAWAQAVRDPGFSARLRPLAIAADAAGLLWAEFSAPATNDGGMFADRAEIVAGLDLLRREILAGRFGRDLTDDVTGPALAALAKAADGELRPDAAVTPAALAEAARMAGKAAAGGTGSGTARAAFDALVTLAAICRQAKIDLPAALSELKP